MRALALPGLIFLVLAGRPLLAQGANLMLNPTRVIFEGRERAAEVMLRNTGNAKATYRIFFQEMQMLPGGEVREYTKPADKLEASDLVRYAPRQVELEPGQTQILRLTVRKPESLGDGEYRSHLVFQDVPPPEPPAPAGAVKEGEVSFKLRPIYGVSIPVVVRHGNVWAKPLLEDLKVTPGEKDAPSTLNLLLKREGNRGFRGYFDVVWVPTGGRAVPVVKEHGVVIYTSISALPVALPLGGAKGLTLSGGRLDVTFTPEGLKHPPVKASLELR